jgi:hypothetical protein
MAVFFKRKPTKEEQIKYLMGNGSVSPYLFNECIDLEKTPNNTWQDNRAINQAFFTVTKSEILSYIKSNYSLRDLGMYDKKCYLNLKKEGDKYIIYTWDYEYEMRTGEVIGMREEYYDSEDEVYERYVRFITGSSGTGLTFEDREED